MPKPMDPLNQLLKHALHQQRVQQTQVLTSPPTLRQKTAGTSQTIPDPVYKDLYLDPTNWTRGRTLALVHKDGSHETFLGVFTELLNPRAKVRRLIRDHSQKAHGTLPREVVHGPYWLRPQVWVPPEDSERETQAIRERFEELLRSIG